MEKETQTKKKSVFSVILSVFSYILLALALFVFLSVTVTRIKGEIPSVFGLSLHVVATPSMQTEEKDSIDVGTIVFIRRCQPSEIKVGSVILFEPYPKPIISTSKGEITADKVLHRVMSIDQTSGKITSTKGDNNLSEDTFEVRTVYGLMIGQSKFLGSIVTFLTQPNAMNLLFGAAIVILALTIAGLVFKIIHNLRHPEGQQQEASQEEKMRAEIEARLRAEMMGNKSCDNQAEAQQDTCNSVQKDDTTDGEKGE